MPFNIKAGSFFPRRSAPKVRRFATTQAKATSCKTGRPLTVAKNARLEAKAKIGTSQFRGSFSSAARKGITWAAFLSWLGPLFLLDVDGNSGAHAPIRHYNS
jgi:hypothetical protein